MLELQLATICASAPALKGFLGDFLRDHFSENSYFRSRTAGDSIAIEPVGTSKRPSIAVITSSTSNEELHTQGDEDILITESFIVKSVDVYTKEGRAALEEMGKGRRVLGV